MATLSLDSAVKIWDLDTSISTLIKEMFKILMSLCSKPGSSALFQTPSIFVANLEEFWPTITSLSKLLRK